MKKINRLIGKIVYSTALKVAEKEVNSVCNFRFYQETLNFLKLSKKIEV